MTQLVYYSKHPMTERKTREMKKAFKDMFWIYSEQGLEYIALSKPKMRTKNQQLVNK